MGRRATKLTAVEVKTAPAGRYGDGGGLFLTVRPNGSRFWVFRFIPLGAKMREMGLGRAGADQGAVPLIEAREKAAELLRLVKAGVDPLAQRDAETAQAAAQAQQEKVAAITFSEAATAYIDAHKAGWSNSKHSAQWTSTLSTYAFPHFGDEPVGKVGTEHVLAALTPIWTTKAETAARVRGRIESVLNYAKARGWRAGENPAAWRGHLALTLPARGKVAPVQHHPALPWPEMGAFMVALRKRPGVAARALEFAILTAARTDEVLGATWAEIDIPAALWTVPASRMKARRVHRVPLSEPALTVLATVTKARVDDDPTAFVFPGQAAGSPLSSMAMLMLLRRMQRSDVTAHGFRSSFRDWTGEATATPREVAEAALAHVVGDRTESAYARGDLFEKRRRLMTDWAMFCAKPMQPPGQVVHVNEHEAAV